MTVRSFVLTAIAIGAAVTASSAMAGAPRELVRYDDLQLATPEGLAELQNRVDKAAWRVCMFDESGMLRASDLHTTCYRATRKEVAVRMARIVAERGQLGG